MKKVLALAIFGGLFALTSCKKNYTCECCYSYLGTSDCASVTSGKIKKKDAESWCEGSSSSSYGYTTTCSLK